MLFKSFIISVLTYCQPILYTSVYAKVAQNSEPNFFFGDNNTKKKFGSLFWANAKDKRDLRKIFNEGSRLSLFNIDTLDNLMDKRAKTLILNIIHDDNHIINDFLHKLPSGRYRSMKYWTALGKDSFVRHSILTLQKIF